MLRCALLRDVIHNFVFKAFPGPAIKVAILWYCITVSESGKHVIFVIRVDVSSILLFTELSVDLHNNMTNRTSGESQQSALSKATFSFSNTTFSSLYCQIIFAIIYLIAQN